MPLAEAIRGTCLCPITCAYGRLFKTARSGGRASRGCLPDGCGGGDDGKGRRAGGASVRPLGKLAISRDRVLVLTASFAVEASSLSTVYLSSAAAINAWRLHAYLITKLKAQPQLVRALYLPILAKLVLDCIAQRRAIVMWEGCGRAC